MEKRLFKVTAVTIPGINKAIDNPMVDQSNRVVSQIKEASQ